VGCGAAVSRFRGGLAGTRNAREWPGLARDRRRSALRSWFIPEVQMTSSHKAVAVLGALLIVAACTREQQADVDTAAGAVASDVRTALSVIDVDMGRKVDAEKKISDKTDDFVPKDTIFASVHTSGTANNSPVIGRWTFQDGSVIDEKTTNVTTTGDAYTVFYIVKPAGAGLAKGKYTFHVLIDGKEVRTKDVTVK
jgi:hypothetical protein